MVTRSGARRLRCAATLALGMTVLSSAPSDAQVNVVTSHYDTGRTGANLNETVLTATNVNVAQFGKLYTYPVDGAVYAQPLYVTGVSIGGVLHNVLYVTTMNDRVYAFDADSNSPIPLWTRDFTSPPEITAVPIGDIVAPNLNITGNVGVESTPVIDLAGGTIYLLARTKESGAYVQKLHALSIVTGAERAGSPVTITGAVAGTAPDAVGGMITFDPKMEHQRAGLALTNGVVVIAWASHEDLTPYHGWVMGYDATTLQRVGVACVTPERVLRRNLAVGPGPGARRARQRLLRDRQRHLGRNQKFWRFGREVRREAHRAVSDRLLHAQQLVGAEQQRP